MSARKTMEELACERGDMAAAIIADHATTVEASRGDDMRLLFDCSILGLDVTWDPDRHDWDGPIADVLAMMTNGLLHERDEFRTIRDTLKEERDRLQDQANMLEFDQKSYIVRIENSTAANSRLRARVVELEAGNDAAAELRACIHETENPKDQP